MSVPEQSILKSFKLLSTDAKGNFPCYISLTVCTACGSELSKIFCSIHKCAVIFFIYAIASFEVNDVMVKMQT
jgi:hypothetical protein